MTATTPSVETDKAIAVRENVAVASRGLVLTTLDDMYRFAQYVCATEFVLPEFRQNPTKTMIAIQYGLEIGLSPIAALQAIKVINSKPSVDSESALALAEASGLMVDLEEWFEGEGETLTSFTKVQRLGRKPHVSAFSWADAVTAGLTKRNPTYFTYPKRMLRARSRGFALHDQFADVLKGLVTREEAEDMPPKANGGAQTRTESVKAKLGVKPDEIDAIDAEIEPAPETTPEAPEMPPAQSVAQGEKSGDESPAVERPKGRASAKAAPRGELTSDDIPFG